MNISVQKLLAKIEAELRLAKSSPEEESLREKVYSIKILCELILDEKQAANEATLTLTPSYQPVSQQQVFQQPTTTLTQPKKLDLNNEANGDSLLDF
jgi:hypothetical protein